MRLAVAAAALPFALATAAAEPYYTPPGATPAPLPAPAAAPPAPAATTKFSVGISAGRMLDDHYEGSDNHSLGVWGRAQLTPWVGVQLEAQEQTIPFTSSKLRGATALIALDLMKGPVVPVVLAGLGVDRTTEETFGTTVTGRHLEAGLALEYRTAGGFVLGADLRTGERTFDDLKTAPLAQEPVRDVPCCTADLVLFLPPEGRYTAVHLTAGMRF